MVGGSEKDAKTGSNQEETNVVSWGVGEISTPHDVLDSGLESAVCLQLGLRHHVKRSPFPQVNKERKQGVCEDSVTAQVKRSLAMLLLFGTSVELLKALES